MWHINALSLALITAYTHIRCHQQGKWGRVSRSFQLCFAMFSSYPKTQCCLLNKCAGFLPSLHLPFLWEMLLCSKPLALSLLLSLSPSSLPPEHSMASFHFSGTAGSICTVCWPLHDGSNLCPSTFHYYQCHSKILALPIPHLPAFYLSFMSLVPLSHAPPSLPLVKGNLSYSIP